MQLATAAATAPAIRVTWMTLFADGKLTTVRNSMQLLTCCTCDRVTLYTWTYTHHYFADV